MNLPDVMVSTYLWLGIFFVSGVVFFGIALWVIFRGGKDVIEILTEGNKKK
jgi:hypothetical protein